ncbi:hypothetical protein EIP86_006073 [Pleurotus ostreatoroseus]|nr:hypothetical protein EIP86_006073 [Pleurotus ostreatoroseus]
MSTASVASGSPSEPSNPSTTSASPATQSGSHSMHVYGLAGGLGGSSFVLLLAVAILVWRRMRASAIEHRVAGDAEDGLFAGPDVAERQADPPPPPVSDPMGERTPVEDTEKNMIQRYTYTNNEDGTTTDPLILSPSSSSHHIISEHVDPISADSETNRTRTRTRSLKPIPPPSHMLPPSQTPPPSYSDVGRRSRSRSLSLRQVDTAHSAASGGASVDSRTTSPPPYQTGD